MQGVYIHSTKTTTAILTYGKSALNVRSGYVFGYQGAQRDNEIKGEGNSYDFGARMQDPRIGRFLSIDPKANKLPAVSPYAFCANNPILMVDPDGQLPWPVYIRSFISTSTTGGGFFYGDGRGPSLSTANEVSSRVKSNFIVDPSKHNVTQPVTTSDPTIFFGVPGQIPPTIKKGSPTGSNDNISFSGNTASFDFSHSGKDPITPGAVTPELDVHSSLSLTENLEAGTLDVKGSFTGDRFPSTEAFIVDQSGKNKVFLGAKMEQGGILDLYGDNKEKLFNVDMQIQLDKEGNFTGVKQGDKTYSVGDWNKNVQGNFKKENVRQ